MQALRFLDTHVKMPLVSLPVRTVVATLSSGTVMVSPGSRLTDDALRSAVAITDIVAPNLFHLGGVGRAAKAHPGARLWGPKGCREKRSDLPWTHVLGVDPWPHAVELPVFEVAGVPDLNEAVFLHRSSGTLIAADLAFNIVDAKGVGARIIFGLFGTFRRFAVSRLYLRAVKDRAAFEASLKRILAEPFDRLVPAHGSEVEADARARLIEAFRERGISL